ncbi:insertion element IS476 uncharacterized 39.2 kDa protein-like [Rhagoletis pomonella]|uniref:insertion element IS476 uncharacterized 39.2 kDa protein-like n=1 Tax=Rhagoletis pomonella TaxID=28610 RepID=UPI0017865731|nr:insertion element IS476 uncharacterized 39.2 kDa protein-like [Rhagoletis pomonella]
MHTIQQTYFISHLEQKVAGFTKNSVKCIISNKKLGKTEGELHSIEKGDQPLQTLHIDHIDLMDATLKKYKYIFSVIDGFTKYVWLFPSKTTSADEVISKSSEWSDMFGYPHRIISDRGPAFQSKAFEDFCNEFGINHVLSTTGLPRGNGQIERANRIILSVLMKLLIDDSSNSYKHVS